MMPRRHASSLLTPAVVSLILFGVSYRRTSSKLAASPPPPTVTLTALDFLEFKEVKEWLGDRSVEYLPRKIVIEVGDVEGSIGPQASDGYVVFDAIKAADAARWETSLLCVLAYNGTLIKVFPTFNPGEIHFDGMKLRDHKHILLAGNNASHELGPQYLLEWRTGKFMELGNGRFRNCHDIQWAHDGAAYWTPGQLGTEFSRQVFKIDAINGKVIDQIDLGSTASDINHAGLLANDSYVIASNRFANSIMFADRNGTKWIAGGPNGTLWMKKMNGELLAPGESLFYGQHNAEYFGDNEYFMFDNNFEQKNASRLLIVEITEDLVSEKWEFVFERYPWGYSSVFGDCDLLPTGNILGTFWPSYLSGPDFEDVSYESRITEITRDTHEIVWDLKIFGNAECEDATCTRVAEGWKLYNAERFYERPLVYNVSCAGDSLFFTTQNNFKQNNFYAGTYDIKEIGLVSTFEWLPHWRPTHVAVAFDARPPPPSVTLAVTNQWGDTTKTDVFCAP